MLQLETLHIGYREKILSADSISLEKGKVYALMGKNGSGKSTLLKTILGQVKPRQGSVLLDGKNVHQLSNKEIAKQVAFVASKFDGIQYLTGSEYIALGRSPHTNMFGKMSSHDWNLVHQVVEELGITYLLTKDTLEMSDGERQIASIAKALVQQAPYILLDEPTSFLDFPNRVKLYELLKASAKQKNVCILHSTHDIEMALRYVDASILVDSEKKHLVYNETLELKTIFQTAFPELVTNE
jgi:iron complex transport system ATP-binding protein